MLKLYKFRVIAECYGLGRRCMNLVIISDSEQKAKTKALQHGDIEYYTVYEITDNVVFEV